MQQEGGKFKVEEEKKRGGAGGDGSPKKTSKLEYKQDPFYFEESRRVNFKSDKLERVLQVFASGEVLGMMRGDS